MKARNTVILVVVFVVLLALALQLNNTPAPSATPTLPATAVFQFDANDVKSIEVRDLQTPRIVKITRAGSEWQVEQPAAKPGDSGSIDTTLGQLVTLQATRVFTDATLFPQYFVTPTIEARLIMSNTTAYALTVGNKTVDGSNYYVAYAGDKTRVFVVSSATIDGLAAWLDTPPYQPTPMPTFTATPPETATPIVTGTITSTATPTTAPPGIVPTLIPSTETPKP